MNLSEANTVVGLILSIGGAILGIIFYLVRVRRGISRETADVLISSRESLETVERRLREVEAAVQDVIQDHENRITEVERDLLARPSRDDVHRMREDATAIRGSIDVLVERIRGFSDVMNRLDNTVRRHEDWLLQGKGDRK